MARKRTVPEPEFVTADFPENNLTCYAWKFEKYGIQVISESREEGKQEFINAYEFEHEKPF